MSSNENLPLSVLISPGQGTHKDNMWELAERYPEVREAYEMADAAVLDVVGAGKLNGKNVSEWAKGDNTEAIALDTRIAQPLTVATSIGLNEVLTQREHFVTAYGNSIGELAALVAAGSLNKEDAIKLSVIRGICSYEASQKSPGRMVVVKNASHEFLSKIKQGEKHGIARAIHFSPDSITYAGTEEVIKNIYETLREGYKRAAHGLSKEERRKLPNAIMLGIPGAFHIFLMQAAQKEYNAAFKDISVTSPTNMLWFSGHSGEYEGDPAIIQKHLVEQLTHEVDLWTHMGKLMLLGHSRFVESGTAPHITNEYQMQQERGNLPRDPEFVFGLDELSSVTG
jgi:[acyl-carrier-protein] S-malonyltransferase